MVGWIQVCVTLVALSQALQIQKDSVPTSERALYNAEADSFEIELDENEMASALFKTVGMQETHFRLFYQAHKFVRQYEENEQSSSVVPEEVSIIVIRYSAQKFKNPEVCAIGSNTEEVEMEAISENEVVLIRAKNAEKINIALIHYFEILETGEVNSCKDKITLDSLELLEGGAGLLATLITPKAKKVADEDLKTSPYFIPANDPTKLNFKVTLYNTTRMDSQNRVFQIKVTDAENERFQVPLSTSASVLPKSPNKLEDYGFILHSDPFIYTITEPGNPDEVYLTSENQKFVYEDRYIQVDQQIASNGRYWGLGDRAPPQFFLGHGVYTSYSRDTATPIETGKPPGNNMYGVHPILFTGLKNGKWMAVYMNNVNAQDWALLGTSNSDLSLLSRFITIGGIVDMYVIIGDRIEEVVKTYHELVGRPVLIPLYSLGYNQCRYGYHSEEALREVFEKAQETKFPMEVLWTDIDYMDRYIDFSIDKPRYPDFAKFVDDTLHAHNVHFVPIIDAGVSANRTDDPIFFQGLKMHAYFTSGYNDKLFIGDVWPGNATFVNFLPETGGDKFWQKNVKQFHSLVPFSGLWLDMNEASNFCNGECPPDRDYPIIDPVEMYGLKYEPGQRSLNDKSVSLNAYMKDANGKTVTQYDHHSLYGYLQALSSAKAFESELNLRPFLISRSTAAGSGRWTSHWLGDNFSTWQYMGISITQVMYFNMYGIGLVGPDTCGFIDNVTQDLCDRWMQLGAFYPFFRNHNNMGNISQEPWAFDDVHLEISKTAAMLRLSLLRFIYSRYFYMHKQGGTLFNPLFFRWEQDQALYQAPEKNFLFGDALLVSPVLEENASNLEIYFPEAGNWANLATDEVFTITKPERRSYELDRRSLFVHMTPGRILPFQKLDGDEITQTAQLSSVRTSLRVTLDESASAAGQVVFDDGVSLLKENEYWQVEMKYDQNKLLFEVVNGMDFKYPGKDGLLGDVIIHGVSSKIAKVMLELRDTKEPVELKFSVSVDGKTVTVETGDLEVRYVETQAIELLN